jgi:hypothetical protein
MHLSRVWLLFQCIFSMESWGGVQAIFSLEALSSNFSFHSNGFTLQSSIQPLVQWTQTHSRANFQQRLAFSEVHKKNINFFFYSNRRNLLFSCILLLSKEIGWLYVFSQRNFNLANASGNLNILPVHSTSFLRVPNEWKNNRWYLHSLVHLIEYVLIGLYYLLVFSLSLLSFSCLLFTLQLH